MISMKYFVLKFAMSSKSGINIYGFLLESVWPTNENQKLGRSN